MKDIIVIGEVCEDIIMHDPETVEVSGTKIWAEDIITAIGGSAAIAASAFASLGENARLHSSICRDPQGQMLFEISRRLGVDCGALRVLEDKRTTRSMIICQGTRKQFLGCSPMLPLAIPDMASLDNAKFIHIVGFMLYPELWTDEAFAYYEEARRLKIPISVDAQCLDAEGVDPFKISPIQRMLGLVDVFFAAEKEVRQFTGSDSYIEVGKKLLSFGVKNVVLKKGAEGCVVFEQNGKIHNIEGYKADVYDTVGSGDIFGAGYVYGMINGFEARDCARFASVFTALSLAKYELCKHYPAKERVMDIIKNI